MKDGSDVGDVMTSGCRWIRWVRLLVLFVCVQGATVAISIQMHAILRFIGAV
jgi:hypothetical protein